MLKSWRARWLGFSHEGALEGTRCLVQDGDNELLDGCGQDEQFYPACSSSAGSVHPADSSGELCRAEDQSNGPADARDAHWLLRLGNHGVSANGTHRRARVSGNDRTRHAILAWRLERPYLAYSASCAMVTAGLLAWNLVKGVQNGWDLPQWKHHRWEEVTEVTIGVIIVVETLLTMRVLGLRAFLSNYWCLLDLGVAVLTIVSIGYGLVHLGRRGELCEASVPLLLLRFVLQPARVVALAAGAVRTRQMQSGVEELRVDFDSLQTVVPGDGLNGSLGESGSPFRSMDDEML